MLYTLKLAIKGVQEEIPVMGMLTGDPTFYTFDSFLGKAGVIEAFFNQGDKLSVIADEASVVAGEEPLVYPVVRSSSSSSGVSVLYQIYAKSPEFSDFETLHKNLAKGGMNVSIEYLQAIFRGFAEISNYRRRQAKYLIAVPPSFAEALDARNAISAYNTKRSSSLTFITSPANRTEKMESEHDRFFIKLPRYEVLSELDTPGDLVPSMSDFYTPYPHEIYYTPHGLYSFDMSPAERESFLLSCIKGTGGHRVSLPNLNVKSIPPIPKKHLIGNSANNTMPYREEEMDFVEALRTYFKYDIKQSLKVDDVEEAYNKGMLSPQLLNFIFEVINTLLQLNWSHTNKIPSFDFSDLNDEAENESEAASEAKAVTDLAQYYAFNYEHDMLRREDGLQLMKGFLTHAANAVGNEAYIQAIIKLGRWGDNKPTVLVIDGYNKYLDLNYFQLRNTTGNVACLKEVLYMDHKYELKAVIINSSQLNDKAYLKENSFSGLYEVPMGLSLDLHLDEGHKQSVYMSMLDVVRHYRENPHDKLIYGIRYENGRFSVDVPFDVNVQTVQLYEIIRNVNKDEESLFVIETSVDCKKVELESSSKRGISPLESIYHAFANRSIMSDLYPNVKVQSILQAEDVAPRAGILVSDILKLNSFDVIIDVIDAVEKYLSNHSELTLDLVLNAYNVVMTDKNFTSEFSFLSEISGGHAPVMKKENAMLNAFTTEGGENTLGMQLKRAMIKELSGTDVIHKLVLNGKVVGGVHLYKEEGRQMYVLTGPSKIREVEGVKSYNASKVVPLIIRAVASMMNDESNDFFFTSTDDMQEFYNNVMSAS